VRQRMTDPTDPPPSRWLPTECSTVAGNLALEEALLDEAHDAGWDGRVVRLWAPRDHAVVIGSSSRLHREVDVAACLESGIPILRRPSGGATVLVGPGCLMWAVVERFPGGTPGLDSIHAACLDPLREALARRGLPVRRAGTSDLVVGDRKVAGNALRVRREAVLYHGTILDSFDIDLIDRLLPHPPREPEYRGSRRHTDFLANLAVGRALVEEALREAFAVSGNLDTPPAERAEALLAGRYLDPAWLSRL
jgi:lipoate-protein ligase A